MRKAGLLLSFILWATISGSACTLGDVVDDIMTHLKNADTKELSGYFSSSVSITLLKDEGVYSKVQAEIILKEFFNRNRPKEISAVQKLDSNPNFRYVVLNMRTEERSLRVSFKLVAEADSFKITELRIE